LSLGQEVLALSKSNLIFWILGNKKAKTKGRLLNENVNQAVIDEKFQISTELVLSEDGTPAKDKMVCYLHHFLHFKNNSSPNLCYFVVKANSKWQQGAGSSGRG
jgi:hypothetical protein